MATVPLTVDTNNPPIILTHDITVSCPGVLCGTIFTGSDVDALEAIEAAEAHRKWHAALESEDEYNREAPLALRVTRILKCANQHVMFRRFMDPLPERCPYTFGLEDGQGRRPTCGVPVHDTGHTARHDHDL